MQPAYRSDILSVVRRLSFLILVASIFTSAAGAVALAQAPPIPARLQQQNLRVLSGRVYKMLEYRLQALYKCDFETHVALESRFRKVPASSGDRETVRETLSIYSDSLKVAPDCNAILDESERRFHEMERSRFRPLNRTIENLCGEEEEEAKGKNCRSKAIQFLADLDPNCMSLQVTNPSGTYDPFPCMAGDYRVGRALIKQGDVSALLSEARAFFTSFRSSLGDPQKRAEGIDLYEDFRGNRGDAPELRERFMAFATMLMASTKSMSSYMQGYHHHAWLTVLKTTGSPEQTIDAFLSLRLLTDEFATLMAWAEQRHTRLLIGTTEIAGMNRHDVMSAYLSCSYRGESKLIQQAFPKLLGAVYEAFDFRTHVKSGMSGKDAWANFKIDTYRYRDGVRWGALFCSAAAGR